ncbi:hypothetical protein PISMIDRAFT_352996 [Pisolithus microcarpus 441]|uniref:Uncharacterized protein n=1 Tax=Pisolithus microcarpus 441 TaxID=765257 RepID=A0A0C9Z781_9AGAM|nr:hypothetical protein PISMIDRAFT_352996 [Pisolithus microcarpus 441]
MPWLLWRARWMCGDIISRRTIFPTNLGIPHSVYSPVISTVSDCFRMPGRLRSQYDVVTTAFPGKKMVLRSINQGTFRCRTTKTSGCC